MGPLAGQILLQSLLAPFIIAGAVMMAASRARAHGSDPAWITVLAPAFAIGLATSTTYILAFGWPANVALNARANIMLAALVGLAFGLAVAKHVPWSKTGLAAGAIAIPLWIGLSALQQGRPESALLFLPIGAALIAPVLIGRPVRSNGRSLILMLTIMAFGIAAVSAFAQALSFAELSLALAGALVAIFIIGREPPGLPATLMAAGMIQALITALLLYSEASATALAILISVAGADRLCRLSSHERTAPVPILHLLVFALPPAAAAILIARIDAGPISIY